jgi:large subunit ribosomal protein L25
MARSKTEEKLQLTVVRREGSGSAPARHLRAQGLIPGIVYGKATEPIPVAVNVRALSKALHTQAGEHALLTLRIEPESAAGEVAAQKKPAETWERPVLVKDVQHDPVDGHFVHVDFHAIVLTERLRVKVTVAFMGTPVGVKEAGGVLEHFLREVEVECLPTNIPTRIDFDVSQLQLGQTVHVRDLPPPPDAKITSDPAGVIASVLKPKEEKPEEAAAVTEPEVITEKKAEAAEGEATTEEGKKETKEAKKEEKKE